MKYSDLENLAREGKLYVTKTEAGTGRKAKYIWDENNDHIIEVKTLTFPKWHYGAKTPGMYENQSYKITKKDFNKLLKIVSEYEKPKTNLK